MRLQGVRGRFREGGDEVVISWRNHGSKRDPIIRWVGKVWEASAAESFSFHTGSSKAKSGRHGGVLVAGVMIEQVAQSITGLLDLSMACPV